ncbi:MAG: DNA polymerase/3'-5' exonuclease PolX [Planctomycetota bacterium]|nr:MAG: DNA polymerase/3'-5' exonuclease PolX [Planctomycetota bacterium]
MTNHEIAAAFNEVADLLEFQGANPFRVRAYRNGAKRIGDLNESLAAIAESSDRSLKEIPGIGDDLAQKITTLLHTGTLPMLAELRREIPPGVLLLARVPGVGPKKAMILQRELGVNSLSDLREACQGQRVRRLKGFGAKTEEGIIKGLSIAETAGARIRWADAEVIVQNLIEYMREAPGVRQLEVAGSYRRGRDTVGDLDLLADADDGGPAMDRFAAWMHVQEVVSRGDTKMTVRLVSGMQVDLRVVLSESFGAALQYFTGSKEHNVVVRARAKQQGLKVNEWGVFRAASADGHGNEETAVSPLEQYVAGRTEHEVYAALGLPWFPPELREAREEFEWAAAGRLPELVSLEDIRGDLHMHTTASDGQHSIEEMVAAARARGRQYIAITDHSKRVFMARGLDTQRLRLQWLEVDRVNRQVEDVEVLKGVECDILEKGGMDLPDDVLAEADWVIASVHYGQSQSRAQITARVLQALENPHVDMLAHPTGRLINRRDPYDIDMDAVLAAAARHGKSLELNANPARLDLHEVHCAAARRLGIPIVINTDAHSAAGMDVMKYGVLQARRGGLTAAHVLNALPWAEFRQRMRRRP